MAAKPQYSETPREFRQRLEQPHNRMGWAFQERPDLDPSASFVLLALAFKARESGTSTLAVETVCRLTRLGRATVQRALKRLVLAGLIVPTGKSPGRWTNKYQLALAPYDLKMPTPGERGPTPKRFPRTGKRASQPSRSDTVQPSRSDTRESRRLRKAKKESPRPAPKTKQPTGSAIAPPARVNGASAPTAPSNGNSSTSREGVSATAVSLSAYVGGESGRPLPGDWLRYPVLERQVARLGFQELGDVLAGFLGRTGGSLPEPEAFFKNYGERRGVHEAYLANRARHFRRRNGRRRTA